MAAPVEPTRWPPRRGLRARCREGGIRPDSWHGRRAPHRSRIPCVDPGLRRAVPLRAHVVTRGASPHDFWFMGGAFAERHRVHAAGLPWGVVSGATGVVRWANATQRPTRPARKERSLPRPRPGQARGLQGPGGRGHKATKRGPRAPAHLRREWPARVPRCRCTCRPRHSGCPILTSRRWRCPPRRCTGRSPLESAAPTHWPRRRGRWAVAPGARATRAHPRGTRRRRCNV